MLDASPASGAGAMGCSTYKNPWQGCGVPQPIIHGGAAAPPCHQTTRGRRQQPAPLSRRSEASTTDLPWQAGVHPAMCDGRDFRKAGRTGAHPCDVAGGSPPARIIAKVNPNGYWVCVVVVELAGTAGVVVVVLVVVVGVVQPDSDTMATAATHAMISFFISMIFVWFVTLPACSYAIGWSNDMGCNPTTNSSAGGGPRRPIG